ncbi:MAG: hypothetical protein KC912_19165 [Proteobacteria bacterium]|nr:hypothetical protein [Pseudomonadota bacterium]
MRFLPFLLIACSDVGTYCGDLSDCTGSDRGSCVEALEDDAAASREAGCSAEWRAWSSCLASEAECVGALYSPTDAACGDELFDWQSCLVGFE